MSIEDVFWSQNVTVKLSVRNIESDGSYGSIKGSNLDVRASQISPLFCTLEVSAWS